MNIAITGGGTGGHLTIAKAIKEELNRRGRSTFLRLLAWSTKKALPS